MILLIDCWHHCFQPVKAFNIIVPRASTLKIIIIFCKKKNKGNRIEDKHSFMHLVIFKMCAGSVQRPRDSGHLETIRIAHVYHGFTSQGTGIIYYNIGLFPHLTLPEFCFLRLNLCFRQGKCNIVWKSTCQALPHPLSVAVSSKFTGMPFFYFFFTKLLILIVTVPVHYVISSLL
jgi:hypothetical protein